jgi:hypothetical protein
MSTVDEFSSFYQASGQSAGTHIALRLNGRVRYTVPRNAAAQRACWNIFLPGRLEIPLRATACLPRLFGAVNCVESEKLASIREAVGKEAGLSCGRSGTPGPWSKDTILFLHGDSAEPLYIVKSGTGNAVDLLLQNEAKWLRAMRANEYLIDHIPEIIAHRSGADLSFVVEQILPGMLGYRFGELHVDFLRKFQNFTRQTIRFEDSRLYHNLRSRLRQLDGMLSEAWSNRLNTGLQRIEQSLSGLPILLVAAHNDFTPWNIRVEHGIARIFDWEYADFEQLPLFDPLHFALMPLALSRQRTSRMIDSMSRTLQLAQRWFGEEYCYEAQTQALAYLMNLCTLYLC